MNKTVEDKECIDEVLRIYDENGRIDINLWKKFSKYNISYAHMCHRLGGIKKYYLIMEENIYIIMSRAKNVSLVGFMMPINKRAK